MKTITTETQLKQVKEFRKKCNQFTQVPLPSYTRIMDGKDLYWEWPLRAPPIEQENVKTLWKDLFRNSILLNNKTRNIFKMWIDWLTNIKDETLPYLSAEDINARKCIHKNKTVTHPQPFSTPLLNSSFELELFTLFLKREFCQNYKRTVTQFIQGIGNHIDIIWGISQNMQFLESAALQYLSPKEPSTHLYVHNATTYGRGNPFYYEGGSSAPVDEEEVEANISEKIAIGPSGLVELNDKGWKIREIGGTSTVTERLTSPETKSSLDLAEFKTLIKGEQAALEAEFKTNSETLIENYKKSRTQISTNNVNVETLNDIRLVIKYLDAIKKISNLSLQSYNEVLVEMSEFLKDPQKIPAAKIQDSVSHLFKLLMMHKQRALAEKSIEKFKDFKADHPLRRKFGDINFLYLDKLTNNNYGKYYDLLGIMADLDKNLDNFPELKAKNGSISGNLNDLACEFDKTIKKLSIIDQQITKNSQMEGLKFLRDRVDVCFENYREQLKTSEEKSDCPDWEELTDLDTFWNETIRKSFSYGDSENYIQAVYSLFDNEFFLKQNKLRDNLYQDLFNNYPPFKEYLQAKTSKILTNNQSSLFKKKPHFDYASEKFYRSIINNTI